MNINNALAAYSADYGGYQAQSVPNLSADGQTLPSSKVVIAVDKELHISPEAQTFINTGQEIMARYNIQDASPKEIATMSLELFDNEVISFEEHAMLSFQPELNSEQYQEIFGKVAEPDVARDFISEWQSKLNEQRSSGTPLEFSKKTQEMIHLLNNLQGLTEG